MELQHCKTCKTDKDAIAFMIGDKCYKQCSSCVKKTWCIHNRQKSSCKECGGSSICSHNRERAKCKECGGISICIHNREKSKCKECGGSRICIHNRQKSFCKECGGSSICIHNRQKSKCKECGGSSICIHNREKSKCKECGGGSICIHNREKSKCKECGGISICIHNKVKSTCYECNPTSNNFCNSTFCDTHAYNKKYDGFCANCFKHLYPDDPRNVKNYQKTKELIVRDYLIENYKGFIHDKVLETRNCDCTHRRRIDFRQIINDTILCIEVDENQHSSYKEEEEIRYNDVYMIFSGKYIFIRFNPDNYRIAGVLKKTQSNTRLNALGNEIDKHIARIEKGENMELLEEYKLYFNKD